MEKMMKLVEKRKSQSCLAEKIAMNMGYLDRMSDTGIRLINLKGGASLKAEVKGVGIDVLYNFAIDSQEADELLSVPMNAGVFGMKTMAWSFSDLGNLWYNRGLNEEQYKCLEKVADLYLDSRE